MFEKVNPSHPDKLADRIAGAIVDLAYKKNERPKIAVEVLIGYDLEAMRYRCVDCGKLNREDELETVKTTYEAYFGVGGMFPNSTPLTLHVCPYCKSEELEINSNSQCYKQFGNSIVVDVLYYIFKQMC